MTPDVSVCNMRKPDWLHDEKTSGASTFNNVSKSLSPSQSVDDFIPKIEDYFSVRECSQCGWYSRL